MSGNRELPLWVSVDTGAVTFGKLEGSCFGWCCLRGGSCSLPCGRKHHHTSLLGWRACPHFSPTQTSRSNTYSRLGPISEILFPFWTCPLPFIQWRAMWRHLTCAWQSVKIKISNRKVKKLICIRHYECLIPNLLFL